MIIPQSALSDDSIRFPSLESLRATHTELLKDFRANGRTPEMIAKVEHFIRRGKATGALLDVDADRWAAQSQLDYWSTQLYQPDYEPPDATLDEFDPQLAPELDDSFCPYLGLDAFHEANESVYFGRARLINDLVSRLKTMRFLAVLGPSGSGKSSVVRAGLIPALKKGALSRSAEWIFFPPMVPGSHPLINLSRLMMPSDSDTSQAEVEAEAYRENPDYLPRVVSERFDNPVILVIDQFEELFTLCTDEVARQRFVENLIGLCQTPGSMHRVIITMRSDFETNIVRLQALQELFEQNTLRITPLTASELRESIEAPAARIGLKFEEGVVNALLSDTLGEPAALPLLQFTLLKLWEKRERNRVTWEAYKKLGGGRQALARSADEFYNLLILEEQMTMRRILLKMVRPGEGLEVTSNRVPRTSLYQKAEANDRIDRVLDRLIRARLVRVSEGDMAADDQVEIAHEALVRNWPRLVEWLEEERVTLRQRQRLTAAAEEWQRLGRVASALLRGELLNEAGRYDDLNQLEKEFVEASYAAEQAEAERVLNEERQQRELEYTKQLAEAEKFRAEEQAQSAAKLRQGRVYLIAALSVVVLLGIIAAGFAVRSNQMAARSNQMLDMNLKLAMTAQASAFTAQKSAEEAQKQAQIARVGELSVLASLKGTQDYDEALLFGVEALKLAEQSGQNEARASDAMRGLLQMNSGLKHILKDVDGEVRTIGFSSDGKILAAGTFGTSVSLWDVSSFDSPKKIDDITGEDAEGSSSDIKSITFSPATPKMAFQDSSGNIFFEDLSKPNHISEIGKFFCKDENCYPEIDIAFSADGKMLASGNSEDNILLWDLTSPNSPKQINTIIPKLSGSASSLAWDPTKNMLAVGSCAEYDDHGSCSKGDISLWDLEDPLNPVTLSNFSDQTGAITDLAFTADGTFLASGSSDATVDLWNVAALSNPTRISVLRGQTNAVKSVALSSNGKLMASVSDREILLWDISSPTEPALINTYRGHTDVINDIAFSPNGEILASGGDDKRVILWNTESIIPPIQASKINNIAKSAISPDGNSLATLDDANVVTLWDISDSKKTMQVGSAQLDDLEWENMLFIPGSKRLVIKGCTKKDDNYVCRESRISIHDISDPAHITEITTSNIPGEIGALAVSPTGKILGIAYCDEWNKDSACNRGQIELASFSSDKLVLLNTINIPGFDVRELMFSPDEKTLMIDNDQEVLLWDITSAKEPKQLAKTSGNSGSILDMAISSDGKRLALGTYKEISYWDISDLRHPVQLSPMQGYTSFVSAVAFNREAKILAAGSEDKNIVLWDLSDQKHPTPIYTLSGLDQVIYEIVMKPDGKSLISASQSVIVWDIDPQSWIQKACQIAGRNFSRTEWEQYFPAEDYRATCPQ